MWYMSRAAQRQHNSNPIKESTNAMSKTNPNEPSKLGDDKSVNPESETNLNPASPEAGASLGASTTAENAGTVSQPLPVTSESPNADHDDIKAGLQTDAATTSTAPARTEAELAVDARVEEETRKQQETRAKLEDQEQLRKKADFEAGENSLHTRALDASLGQVEHMGCRGVYIGKSPQSEKDESKCPSCAQTLTGGNSIFRPLPYVVPEAGMLVKDSESGEFFALPSDGSLSDVTAQAWLTITNPSTGELFVPKASEAGTADRRAAAGIS